VGGDPDGRSQGLTPAIKSPVTPGRAVDRAGSPTVDWGAGREQPEIYGGGATWLRFSAGRCCQEECRGVRKLLAALRVVVVERHVAEVSGVADLTAIPRTPGNKAWAAG